LGATDKELKVKKRSLTPTKRRIQRIKFR